MNNISELIENIEMRGNVYNTGSTPVTLSDLQEIVNRVSRNRTCTDFILYCPSDVASTLKTNLHENLTEGVTGFFASSDFSGLKYLFTTVFQIDGINIYVSEKDIDCALLLPINEGLSYHDFYRNSVLINL